MAPGAGRRQPSGSGRDRLRPRLQLPQVACGDHDSALECREPQSADQDLAGDDRGHHPGAEDVLVEEDDQGAEHQHLVGDRVEEGAERARLSCAARDSPVEPVGRHGEREDPRRPVVVVGEVEREERLDHGRAGRACNRQLVRERHLRGEYACGGGRLERVIYSRAVDLYEYQGKQLLGRYGIPVSAGRLASTPEEARRAAEELGGPVVVKAQVLSGGRGKAGGVKLAGSPADAAARAEEILGLVIRGHVTRRLWVESASEIAREYYLAVTLDRGAQRALLMFTTRGGVEIEQVAAESPEALVRVHVDPLEGYEPHHARALLAGVADEGERAQLEAIAAALYRCFVESDATLCEINPLIVTPEGQVRALDAKVTIDDSALFRQAELAALRDSSAADPLEALARERGVIYVKLDGSVGIVGNGAGLSMATVDVVVAAGGRPANFCDLGGGGSAEGVVAALEVISSDPQVRSILFNIFGGITRCDEVARGILAALDQSSLELPIVLRLDGTNASEGRRILAEATRPNLHVEPTMLEAAARAVELAA